MSSRPVIALLEDAVPAHGLEEVARDADLLVTRADGFAEAVRDADALLMWDFFSDTASRVLAAGVPPRLRWIHVAASGVDGILSPAVVDADVQVTNAAGVFERPIAEYVLACVVAHAKHLARSAYRQQRREWLQRETVGFTDLRVVVLGAGAIGREVGRLLGAIGMNVALVGRAARDTSDGPVRAASELEDLLADADVFVVALPLTAQTRGLVDEDVLRALPSSSLFVNVGRGLTVDEPALVSALREGRMAAAALDAFAVEPLPRDSPLWSDPRVFVSPHSSSRTRGWRDQLAAQFVEQFRLWHAGRPLTATIDKRRGY